MRIAQFPFLALFVLFVPRMMGAETYGIFAFLISLVTMIGSMVNLGVGDTFGRFIPALQAENKPGLVEKFVSNFLVLKTLVTLVTVAVVTPVLFRLYAGDINWPMFAILAAIVIIVDWESVVYSLLFGQNRLLAFSVREPLRRALSLGLILWLFPQFGLLGALGSTLLVEISMLVLGCYWTRHTLRHTRLRIDTGFLRPYIKFGLNVYLIWFLLNVWQRLGNVLVERLTGEPSQIAYFDIANQFFLIIISITVMVINSLIPIFSSFQASGNTEKIQLWSRRIVKYMTIVNVMVVAGVIFLGEDLIPFLIGRDFEAVTPNLLILCFGLFPSVLIQFGFVQAVVRSRPQQFLFALFASLIVFIGLSLFLVPRYQSEGCSMATVLSYFFMATVLLYPMRSEVKPLLVDSLRAVAPGILMLALLPLKGSLVENILLTVAYLSSYGALLLLFRVLSIREVLEIVHSLRPGPAEGADEART